MSKAIHVVFFAAEVMPYKELTLVYDTGKENLYHFDKLSWYMWTPMLQPPTIFTITRACFRNNPTSCQHDESMARPHTHGLKTDTATLNEGDAHD